MDNKIEGTLQTFRAEKGDFAKVVLMPGDPLRAQGIAQE